jgi:hypothetical protein
MGRDFALDMFLVRRRLPAVPESAVRAAVERCRTHAEDLARSGHRIRYVGCASADDGFCGCLYEASSPDVVRLATERAAVPYDEIIRVFVPRSATAVVNDDPSHIRTVREGRHDATVSI